MPYSIFKPTVQNISAIANDVGVYPMAEMSNAIEMLKFIYPHSPMFHNDVYVTSIAGEQVAYQVNTLSRELLGFLLDDTFTELNFNIPAMDLAEESVRLGANVGLGVLTQQLYPKEFNISNAGNNLDTYEFPDVSSRYMQRVVPLARLAGHETFEDFLASLDKKRRYKCKEAFAGYEAEFTPTLSQKDVVWITSRVNENFPGHGKENFYQSEIAMLQWLPFLHTLAYNIRLYDKATGALAAIASFSRIAKSPDTLVYNCYAGDRKFKNTGLTSLVSMIQYLYTSGTVKSGSVTQLHVGYDDDFSPNPYGTYKRHCCNAEIQSLKLLSATKYNKPFDDLYPPYYDLDYGKWVTK